ncbi:MAG TPA: hypothetical protein P5543_08385 [Planctomycetota bacterium]|nr:hypothetical protein [Planctomycetota bacterium]HRU52194.1 hypothetical protein [Planctomycetota bacterium]
MRLDLHNHTLLASNTPSFSSLKKLYQKRSQAFYFRTLKSHHVDGIAITNHHEIDTALELFHHYPKQVIVGSEYRVLAGEGTSALITVLSLNKKMHDQLMQERLRGIKHFTDVLREQQLPFFLSHLGWGIPTTHPKGVEIFDHLFQYIDALEVLDAYTFYDTFSLSIAKYYNLSPIAGTGYLHPDITRYVYTESAEATTLTEFWQAIQARNVRVGTFEKKYTTTPKSFRNASKDFYQKQIKKIWHTEFGFWQHFTMQDILENLEESIVLPTLQSLPHLSRLQQMEEFQDAKNDWKMRYIDYLKKKEIAQIFQNKISPEEKINQCIEKLSQINHCFNAIEWNTIHDSERKSRNY